MSEIVGNTTDSSFEQDVIQSSTPVLVDFWAPWCGPCKAIAPILEELGTQFDGKLLIKKINIDENPKTPAQYQVRGIPNLMFFKDGKLVEQVVGAVKKDYLANIIETKLLV